MSAFTIRLATENDLEAIRTIYNYYVLHSTCTYQLELDTAEERLAWFRNRDSATHPVTVAEQAGGYEPLAVALCERSLLAMERNEWDRAEILANQLSAVSRRSGLRSPPPVRCWPAWPCIGETPWQYASSSSLLSGCGLN